MSEHPVLFLSHSGLDTETARELKRRLLASPEAKAAGLEIWFDKDDLLPGQGWQEQLEKVITTSSTAFAVIVGTKGVVNWVDREVRVALSRATEGKNYPFIPVFASPNFSSSLPPFARQYQGVHDPINNEVELGKLLRAVLASGPGERDSAGSKRPVKLTDSPFVGLRAMTEADADLFFGREAELDALIETLRANRLVAIVADSGSGKSSLAQAGLIPRIRGGALEDKSREAPDERAWQVVVMRPGADPVENLRVGVTEAAERLGLPDEAQDAGSPRSPHFRLKGLTTTVQDSAPPSRAGSNSYMGLAAIVHRPLILAGNSDEAERNGLLAAIRRDVSDRPGDLALVQMALRETWRESKAGRENLLAAYSRVGGVAGALAHAAEEVRTSKLTNDETKLLEAVLVRLVDLGDTGGATRRVAKRDEFDAVRNTLAEKLTTEECRRVLLAGSDTIEICHERLITQWPWWQNCLNAAAMDMRRLARLMKRAAEWASGDKERRNLATGGELDLYKEIADRRKSWLSQTEIAFVDAAALWAKIWRFAGIAAVIVLGVFSVLMTYFSITANRATIAANQAKNAVAVEDNGRRLA